MKLKDLEKVKLHPLGEYLAFKWIKPKLESKFIVPESHWDKDIRVGRFYIGEVLAKGPDVSLIEVNDFILISEYSIKNIDAEWKEDQIYFVKQIEIPAKVIDFEFVPLDMRTPVTKGYEEHLEAS